MATYGGEASGRPRPHRRTSFAQRLSHSGGGCHSRLRNEENKCQKWSKTCSQAVFVHLFAHYFSFLGVNDGPWTWGRSWLDLAPTRLHMSPGPSLGGPRSLRGPPRAHVRPSGRASSRERGKGWYANLLNFK